MLRPLSLLPALALAASALVLAPLAPGAPGAAAAAAAPARSSTATPLALSIDGLSSSTIPAHGPIRVSGTVTNRDTSDWTTVRIYAFISATPMTSQVELAEAAAVPADTEVGGRIIDLGDPRTADTIDVLGPGETARFSITIPHDDIDVTEQGVYWFGVHALGQGPDGRDLGADGRARTFLPFIAEPRRNAVPRTVKAALVVPIRRQIVHASDGSIGDVDSWVRYLGTGGPLRSLVDLGVAAGSRPITWLVDPAVPDAVRQLVAGNPPRSLGSTVDDEGDGGDGNDGDGGDESGSPDPSASASEDPAADGADAEELSPELQDAAAEGSTWLEALHQGLEGQEILALPYGDVDVAAAAEHDPGIYRAARKRAGGDLQPWGLATSPAVSSPTGYIDADGIRLAEPGSTVLVTDRLFGARAPSVVRTEGRTLVVSSSGAASGGPGPNQRLAPLAVRQRILSEAAVRLLNPGRKPLVVTLPATWAPESTDGFFEGLDVDWLDLTTLADIRQRTGTDVPADRLRYPDSQRRLELDADAFTAAGDLVQAGETLQNLLTRNDQVAATVTDEAFTDISYSSRLRPETSQASAGASRAWIETQLRGVHIDAPRGVILSSGSGRFSATLTNTLDQAVSVKVRAEADPPLRVSVPNGAIEIPAGQRATVLLNASSSGVGIRNVRLLLTDVDDVALGSSDDLPIRANQVSNVIWLIIGTGVALLFGAILVRLVRRVRTAARS